MPFPNAVCVQQVRTLPAGVTSSPTTLVLQDAQQLQVDDTVVLLPVTVTSLEVSSTNPGRAPIIVSGSLTLAGTLQLTVPPSAGDGQAVPLITVVGEGRVQGAFSSVNVSSPDRPCDRVKGDFDATTLSVLLRTDDCANGGLTAGAIAGIVVGSAVAVTLLVGALGWLYWRRRKTSLRGAVYDRN